MQEYADAQSLPASPSWIACFLPGSARWFFLWFMTLFLLFAPGYILGDGAVARHICTGIDIIEKGRIAHNNYVWAINPNEPWLTHELLGDIAFAASYLLFKLNGVVLLGFLVIGTALTWSYQIARAQGLGKISGWLIFVPVFLAQSLHWLSRSHIFSYLFLLILYYANFVAKLSVAKRLLISMIVMIIWCNFHGSIFIGLFLLVISPIDHLLNSIWSGTFKTERREIALEFLIPLSAALALCINIRGMDEYSYLISYLGHPEIIGKGSEWHSLDFAMGIGIWAFLSVFFMLLSSWRLSSKPLERRHWLLCITLFFAGIYVMRLIPYFALLALPCLGISSFSFREHWLSCCPQSRIQSWLKKFCEWDKPEEPPSTAILLRNSALHLLLLAAVISIFLLHPRFAVKDFPPEKLPVAAVAFMKDHKISGLGFALDNWGPYLYYKFKQPIFIDEKTDFYPLSFIKEYHQAYDAETPQVLDKYKIDYVLIQPQARLVHWLDRSNQWQKCFEDKVSVLYLRRLPQAK